MKKASLLHAISHLPILLVPLVVGFIFHTPFTWTKLLLTLIPVIPAIIIIDGIISVKAYSSETPLS